MMTLDKFNVNEIQKKLEKISNILDMEESFEKDLRLHNELFIMKAIVDSWEFNTEIRINDWKNNI